MESQGFRDLAAYRKTGQLADEIALSVRQWPSFDQRTVGIQLVSAADSVGANVAEAYGRWGQADRLRLPFIARGSFCELEDWLARAAERGLKGAPDALESAHEIGRMLNGLANSWRAPLLTTGD
jgi:four helix bundle protein